ncbi:phosphopantothenoylcysteine decarboxylase [Pontiella sp.]|uniref:phosphopantothenoylcysteine decarboxylase domain-containing protein n=1 Tax=Pontiella sp. TaxID=2837462 RepID=UPI00356347BA
MSKTILILSGPTHEYIDPVRFIGNASSGLMGKAIAEEAAARGYAVEFVSGPVAGNNLPQAASLHRVTSAQEMLDQAQKLFPSADATVFAAAVADYAPAEKRTEKMAKSTGELILHLRPTPDIAKTLCANKRADQVAIGFALQTSDGEFNATRKLEGKNLDGIVLNTPATLGAQDGDFSFLSRSAEAFAHWGVIDKAECAKRILDAIGDLSA